MNIGELIKSERKNKRITQKELAKLINKSERMIQKYENGEVTPSIEILTEIGKNLGVFFFDFDTDTDKNNSSDYFLEQYCFSLGYKIIYDEEDGYIILKTKNAEYEIEMNDLEELKTSSKSFIEFKLQELINKSRKIGK